MVTDEAIAEALDSLIRESTPSQFTSINGVVLQLESKLGLNLSHKLDFIRSQIHLFFQSHQPQSQPPPRSHPHNSNPERPFYSTASNQFLNWPSQFRPSPHRGPQFPARPNSCPSCRAHWRPCCSPRGSASRKKRWSRGLNKVCGVSPELQAIVGQPALPRTEEKQSQDPSNKRKIICNDELRLVFETDSTDMFKMNKLLAKHIIPLEPTKQSGEQSKKLKVDAGAGTKSSESGPYVVISEALANFFGTSGREMLQSEVLRRVWEYIKVNHLEDPLNSMVILCDAKLQEIFGCESISALGIPEILMRHHLCKRS
ncbi:hypothetical protein AAG906_011741 [Vitis piasezkii]